MVSRTHQEDCGNVLYTIISFIHTRIHAANYYRYSNYSINNDSICIPTILIYICIEMGTSSWRKGETVRIYPLEIQNANAVSISSIFELICFVKYYRAAPNASGIRSTVYLYPLMYMQGTPGIFRIRPRNSLSHVATMKHRHCCAMLVKQSSAYPFFLQLHGTRSKRGSFASLSAILYLPPNFSSSAMTQSVMQGIHLANKQSIMARTMSSFFLLQDNFWWCVKWDGWVLKTVIRKKPIWFFPKKVNYSQTWFLIHNYSPNFNINSASTGKLLIPYRIS